MTLNRRGVLAVLVGLLVALAAPSTHALANEFTTGANKFVRSLADEAVASLTSKKVGDRQRESALRKILRSYFDVNSIGRRALGRYWKKASKSEKVEYLHLFEDLIVSTYAKRFKDYSNEKLSIEKATSSGNQILVHSLLARGAQKPIRVDWRLDFPDGKYKIIDIVVEGVSMVQTQRSEFSSVIRRSGGEVKGLLTALKNKTLDVSQN